MYSVKPFLPGAQKWRENPTLQGWIYVFNFNSGAMVAGYSGKSFVSRLSSMSFFQFCERILNVCGGKVCERLLFHAHRDPTDRNGGVCFGIKDHELPAYFLEQLPIVFHQAVTGVDVSAGRDGAGAVNFGVGGFRRDLLDRHERPAGEHPLPFFGETGEVVLALTFAQGEGQVCQAA